jgi:hypothetical protein
MRRSQAKRVVKKIGRGGEGELQVCVYAPPLVASHRCVVLECVGVCAFAPTVDILLVPSLMVFGCVEPCSQSLGYQRDVARAAL